MRNELTPHYEQILADGGCPGYSVLPYAWRIRRLINMTGATSILDYGCGQGKQYDEIQVHQWWGVPVARYEPAVPRWSELPAGRFGGVVCTDVLEHVPEEQVDQVIADVLTKAEHFVFFTACCRASTKSFPDGRNLHITLRPITWWWDRLRTVRAACGHKVTFSHWELHETP